MLLPKYSIVLLFTATTAFMKNGQQKSYHLPYDETYEKNFLEDFDDTFPTDLMPINAIKTSTYTNTDSTSAGREKQIEEDYVIMKRSIDDDDDRSKRDVSLALLAGIIGMTSEAVLGIKSPPYQPPKSSGGCEWLGTSPFCYDSCPSDYDLIREHSGRCSDSDAADCVPDPSFGEPCMSLFGREFTKKFCCKSDPKDCTWSGRWMGSHDAFNHYCRYDGSIGRCGRLDCSVNHYHFRGHNSTEIGGEHCDELYMWDLKGWATCGYVAWYDQSGTLINSWYKTH